MGRYQSSGLLLLLLLMFTVAFEQRWHHRQNLARQRPAEVEKSYCEVRGCQGGVTGKSKRVHCGSERQPIAAELCRRRQYKSNYRPTPIYARVMTANICVWRQKLAVTSPDLASWLCNRQLAPSKKILVRTIVGTTRSTLN